MKRPAGITIGAVLVFVGSAITLFTGALMALSFVVATPNGSLPHGFVYVAVGLVLGSVVFGGWGIASGVGLLNLREWSRISLIVFSVLLLAISVPGFFMMLLVKLPVPPNSPDPALNEKIMTITRFGGAGVYAILTALAILGLLYFKSPAVKAEFTARRGLPSSLDLESAVRPGPYSGGRPLSITIIAGLMALGTLTLPLYLAVFQFPMMFLGFFFTGPAALLIIFAFAATQGAIAYGLWYLQPWGRNLAIYYFNFAIFNSIISVILPGAQTRYEDALATMQSQLNLPAPTTQMHFPMWLSLVFGLPFIAVQLWFLIATKPAFEGRPAPPDSR
ncbi:MAG TPA: hypothetical protein VGD60_09900 [Candidatus Acidoferrales bacterium]